jgi:formylglycine-generating enzyme required for sulfatase activity
LDRYNLQNIRTLLTEGFSDEQLRRFCYDLPEFRPVYDQLAQVTGKAAIIDRLLEHAERTLQLETLLAWAKENNPSRYQKHGPYHLDRPVLEPPLPSPGKPPVPKQSERIPRIFLCHASEDKPRVMELYRQLQDAGYRPWMDKFDLLPGQNWRREIEKIIRDPYNLILVCLSNNSITKRGVVQQEMKWALDILDQMPENAIYLIPVRLEACEAPQRLSELHWVNLFEPDGFEYLKRALDYEISRSQEESDRAARAPGRNSPSRSPELKPALTRPPQTPSPQQPIELKPLIREMFKLPRDPIRQMFGSVVNFRAWIALTLIVAWLVYTIFAGRRIPTTPTPTSQPSATIAAIATQPIPIINSPSPTLTNTPPGPTLNIIPTNTPTDTPTSTTPAPTPTVIPATATPVPTNTPFPTNTPTPIPPMVLVPAGPFQMGSNQGDSDEQPVHEVTLAAFYIDQYEVTNAQYRRCVEAGGCNLPSKIDHYRLSSYVDHPVVYVTWYQAQMYCEWRGVRLPTEAEWEKAARGTDGRIYPWGDTFDGNRLNFCDKFCGLKDRSIAEYDDGYTETAPIGSFPNGVSPYNVYDMAGNVWEWVQSKYNTYPYQADDGRESLEGTNNRVFRGGSYLHAEFENRTVRRRGDYNPNTFFRDLGFRCAVAAAL